MVQFLSIIFFLGFLQFLLGFSKVPIFLCHPVFSFYTSPNGTSFTYITVLTTADKKLMSTCLATLSTQLLQPVVLVIIGPLDSQLPNFKVSIFLPLHAYCEHTGLSCLAASAATLHFYTNHEVSTNLHSRLVS